MEVTGHPVEESVRRQRDRLRDKARPLPVSLPLALPASELRSAETVQDGGGGTLVPQGCLLTCLFVCFGQGLST